MADQARVKRGDVVAVVETRACRSGRNAGRGRRIARTDRRTEWTGAGKRVFRATAPSRRRTRPARSAKARRGAADRKASLSRHGQNHAGNPPNTASIRRRFLAPGSKGR